jgi:2-keto-4-pentenoate hydratase/2-oxohepta-3-ene-1,7-dioic acid hydratase in catechol pathway
MMMNLIHNIRWQLILQILAASLLSSYALAKDTIKYVHFEHQGDAHYGIIKGDNIQLLNGDIFSTHEVTDKTVVLAEVTLLPATFPSKIIAVGLNYSSHFSSTKGYAPRLFSKLPSSLTGHEQAIWLYPNGDNLHYEGELVVVIGKTARNVSVKDAPEYIFGVTAGNDVTERSWQSSDLQWLRGKGADSFAPVSPWISTNLNYNDLLVETRINGKTVQSESTKSLLFSVDEIVSYASQYHTLNPGDLIFTGTPGSTRAMKAGDIVEVEVEGVGVVRNTVTPVK